MNEKISSMNKKVNNMKEKVRKEIEILKEKNDRLEITTPMSQIKKNIIEA